MQLQTKKKILMGLMTGGVSILSTATMANFAEPFVTKGSALITQLTSISKIICAIGIVWCTIDFVICKLKDSPVNWGKIGVIGVVSVILGSIGKICTFLGI